jgi:hypothetical protein
MAKPTLTACGHWCNLALGLGPYLRHPVTSRFRLLLFTCYRSTQKCKHKISSARQTFSTPLLELACFMNPKQRANHECARPTVQVGDLP